MGTVLAVFVFEQRGRFFVEHKGLPMRSCDSMRILKPPGSDGAQELAIEVQQLQRGALGLPGKQSRRKAHFGWLVGLAHTNAMMDSWYTTTTKSAVGGAAAFLSIV